MRKLRAPNQTSSTGITSKAAYSFDLSAPTVNNGTATRDRMLLLAAYNIAKHMVNDPSLPSSHVQLLLVPKEGAATKFLHRTLIAKDTIGLYFITGMHDEKKINAVFLRRKSKTSEAESRFARMGARPSVSAEPHAADLDKLISYLKNQLQRKISSAKTAQLSKMLVAALAEKEDKKHYFGLVCDGNKAKLEKMHEIFHEISAKVQALIDLNVRRKEEGRTIDPELCPSRLVKAAANFPLTQKEMEAIYRRAKPSASDYLGRWPRDFVLKSLSGNIGVDALEYTSKDAIASIQSMLQIAYMREGQSLNPKLQEFDKSMHALLGLIDDVDDVFARAKMWVTADPEKWIGIMFKLAGQRSKILEMLKDMEKKAEVFHHEAYNQKQLLLILANLSANLCRISRAEISAWNGFLKDEGVQQAFKSKELRPAKKRIDTFIRKAEAERNSIAEFETQVKGERTAFKKKREELHQSISESIHKLEKISPIVANKLAFAYESLLGHLPYKQGEVASPFIETAYFPKIELLLSLKGKMPESNFEYSLERNKAEYANLFELLSSKEMLLEEILRDISNLLYAQQRAFDLVVTSNRLHSKSLGDQDLEVQYWVSQKNNGTSDNPVWGEALNLQFLNRAVQIPLRQTSPLEQEVTLSEASSKKPIDEELYGKQFAIKDVIGEDFSGGGLGDIYHGFFEASQQAPELFSKVHEKLKRVDLSTAHFLSTLAEQDNYGGVVSNVLGNLKPAILSNKNSDFPDLLRSEYPDFEKEAKEMQDFVRIGVAKRVVRWLHANLPYYMQRYAEIVMSESD